jgi:hypothetical protein
MDPQHCFLENYGSGSGSLLVSFQVGCWFKDTWGTRRRPLTPSAATSTWRATAPRRTRTDTSGSSRATTTSLSLPDTESDLLRLDFRVLLRDVVYLCWPIAPSKYETKCGGREGIAGSQPMSIAGHITCHWAQINFGDLPPYLTYG